ncbi:ATP-dependent Clp protease ATP-binding subunit [Fulvivirga sediminis]|uniref:ATP-dependent Clp protease ATP-binding subunit n=1 Tax=Fulvivirga sediminis TaxID=2803949 RepID=A0A937FAY1_9BACT|nr:ATP-dependent Clp protease ATP-binding subunit [Fulvivirga sediminis]MBL3658895.1 ATP-dependent Clp protease ATP-binding subunit [Fulvivirga sediminis]
MQLVEFSLEQRSKTAIHIAQSLAKEYHNNEYNAAHLLKALLHKDSGLDSLLLKLDLDVYYFEEWCDVRIESLPKKASISDTIDGDRSVESVFNEADSVKLKLGEEEITPTALFIAICTPGVGFSYEQLKTLPIKAEDILQVSKVASINGASEAGRSVLPTGVSSSVLGDYCIDKVFEADQGQLQAISGRDAEIKMMLEVLGRHSKPNVLITGEPGVGKSVLLDGFTQVVVNESVPTAFKGAQIYELDYIQLVSGATYKSEIEDRFKKVLNALKSLSKPILLIDEINNITNKENGNPGLVNILKSELAKGQITFIGTSTNDAFRKNIENDEGLFRRFEVIGLEEPNEARALKMIADTIDKYSNHHSLKVDEGTIAEAIRLSKRFNKERSLPDSAIDLIDRTMSATRYMLETTADHVQKVKTQVKEIKESNSDEAEKLAELEKQWMELKGLFSYLLFEDWSDEAVSGITAVEDYALAIENVLDQFQSKVDSKEEHIEQNDVAATIANKTGIPAGKLRTDEKERLLTMEDELKKRVIGQDHAIVSVTEAILESRSGLSKPGLPIGSFFFTGPTGTGKTELAKSLAEFLFQTEEAIIRFDMSEFKEEHSAALLYGAPPGYVGYEEGGLLVNKIRQKPYSIVLFDEIEKAHPSVFDIFLQILDEGKLSDRLGKTGDFSNAVVLFTSNIGSEHVAQSFSAGEIPKSTDLLDLMSMHFRPEFLGRLTEIVPFSPITEDGVIRIFDVQMKDLYKALEKQEITLNLSDDAKSLLAHKGFTPKYGARPIRGVIRSDLRSPLSRKIISGEIAKGSVVNLSVEGEELVWQYS